MKRLLTLLFLAVLLVTGCRNSYIPANLPRGEVSPEWTAAADSFYIDAVSVAAPD